MLLDALNLLEAITVLLGNARQKLEQVQMLPVFIGIGLGFYLAYSYFFPGIPVALKLGLAGGPLVVAFNFRTYWYIW